MSYKIIILFHFNTETFSLEYNNVFYKHIKDISSKFPELMFGNYHFHKNQEINMFESCNIDFKEYECTLVNKTLYIVFNDIVPIFVTKEEISNYIKYFFERREYPKICSNISRKYNVPFYIPEYRLTIDIV